MQFLPQLKPRGRLGQCAAFRARGSTCQGRGVQRPHIVAFGNDGTTGGEILPWPVELFTSQDARRQRDWREAAEERGEVVTVVPIASLAPGSARGSATIPVGVAMRGVTPGRSPGLGAGCTLPRHHENSGGPTLGEEEIGPPPGGGRSPIEPRPARNKRRFACS